MSRWALADARTWCPDPGDALDGRYVGPCRDHQACVVDPRGLVWLVAGPLLGAWPGAWVRLICTRACGEHYLFETYLRAEDLAAPGGRAA